MDKICLIKDIIKSNISDRPYKLNFMVTAACNSRCVTCNIWREFKSNPGIVKDELKYEEIVKIFKKLPDTVSWLSITGGEPFLRGDIYRIMRAAIRYIPNMKIISMPSNGLLQDRVLDTIKRLSKIDGHPQIIITFSIDGPGKLHDNIRGVKGGFKRTWDTYRKAKKLVEDDDSFLIAIETTLSSMNIDVIRPFLSRLLDKDHAIAVTVAHDAFLYKNIDDKSLQPGSNMDEIISIIDMLNDHLSFFEPRAIIERKYLNKVPGFLRDPSKKVIPCKALKSSFSLSSTGDIYPCLMWGKKLANIRDYNYDLKKIWKSNKFEKVRKDIYEDRCPNCWTPCEAYQSIIGYMIKGRIFF